MTTEQLARAFRYRKGSILSPWRDVSRDEEPSGDCQDWCWSVLLVTPDGTACMAASGSAFEVIAPEPAGVDG